jgi:hypothetical protein
MVFQFNKGDTVLALVDKPRWIRMQANGFYGLCLMHEATGIAIGDTIYSIEGREPIEGADEAVTFAEIDLGEHILTNTANQQGALDDITGALEIILEVFAR